MQGRHRRPDAKFRPDQAHAADAPGGGPQQGHDRINAEQAAAPQPHHQSRHHQGHGDQDGGTPQQA